MALKHSSYLFMSNQATLLLRPLSCSVLQGNDRWSLNNIHYIRRDVHAHPDRIHVLGARSRRNRAMELRRCGLDKKSRKLLASCRPCSINLCQTDLTDHISFTRKPPATNADIGENEYMIVKLIFGLYTYFV